MIIGLQTLELNEKEASYLCQAWGMYGPYIKAYGALTQCHSVSRFLCFMVLATVQIRLLFHTLFYSAVSS